MVNSIDFPTNLKHPQKFVHPPYKNTVFDVTLRHLNIFRSNFHQRLFMSSVIYVSNFRSRDHVLGQSEQLWRQGG